MKRHLLLLLLAGTYQAIGQSVTPVLLGAGTSDGGQANVRIFWSVGELSTTTLTSAANQITQGFWQPDVAKFTGANAPFQDEYAINCLPNPVSNDLYITLKGDQPVCLALFSPDGRLLYRESSISNGHVLSMAPWPAALYWLQFSTADGAWILTQKIVKQ